MFGNKDNKEVDLWDEIPDDAPRSSVMLGISAKQRFAKAYIWFSAIALAPLLVLTFVAFGQVIGLRNAKETPQATVEITSPGRAAATRVLNAWLGQEPSPLPGGVLVSWDGAEEVPFTPVFNEESGKQTNEKPGYISELNSFTLLGSEGASYRATVQVLVDPRGGAKPLGGPSLERVVDPANDSWSDGAPWPGLISEQNIPEAVQTAVEGWSEAYVSGRPPRLASIVGDGDPSHIYTPLYGVSVSSVEATDMATPDSKNPGRRIVRVEMQLLWDGQKLPDVADSKPLLTTMDLLVERADGAAPVVTAWGGPGSGPLLKRYGNADKARAIGAVPTRTVDSDPTPPEDEDAATPSSSPSPSVADTQEPNIAEED